MTRDDYRKLLPLVNDHDQFGLLRAYANARIEVLRTFLENQKDIDKIRETQGAIAELRRFATLRDEVITKSKE